MKMTKMQKWSVMLFAALAILLSGIAHAAVPGWQCYPFAGVAEYTVTDTACTGHAPVFAYLGDGQTALAYYMVSLTPDSPLNCFEAETGWTPLELGAQMVNGYGAATLRGDALDFSATPGAPADQSCLDSIRPYFLNTRVVKTRIDDHYILLTVEPLPALVTRGKR